MGVLIRIMKTFKQITIGAGVLSCLLLPLAAWSADTNAPAASAPVPDKMTTCPVSGDKLGEMDKPYVFVYQGQEVKLCCSGCKKDFDKDPAKYVAKIRAADHNKN